MSEVMYDNWLNLAPETQMQVLGVLMMAASCLLVGAECYCADGATCSYCETEDALALLESRCPITRGV